MWIITIIALKLVWYRLILANSASSAKYTSVDISTETRQSIGEESVKCR